MKRSDTSWSGIVYALLFVLGAFLLTTAEPESKTDEEILAHFADGGNRATMIVGFFVMVAAALCWLWFVNSLRSRLQTTAPEARSLSTLGFGASVAAASLLIAAATSLAGIAFVMEDTSRFVPEPDTARLVVMIGYLLLIGGALVNCVVVATTSVLALRTAVLPTWAGWVGVAAIALTLAEIALLPVLSIPVWAVIVSITVSKVSPGSSEPARGGNPTAAVQEMVPAGR